MKNKISFLLIFVLYVVAPTQQVAAKTSVKIATIGSVSPYIDLSLTNQQMVDAMIVFLEEQIAQVLPDQPDLIVLPEACDRPAKLKAEQQYEYFIVRGNQVQNYLASIAKENHCYIAFGMKRKDKDVWRNSCVMLDRNGQVAGIYDKNFPTPDEMQRITASDKVGLIQTDFGTVGCAICFDLNFDELRERYAKLKPDLLVYIGMYHGGLEQAKWAFSCRSWFVGSVGISNLPSQIRNPFGKVVATTPTHFNFVVSTINLDCELAHLDHNVMKIRELKKKYGENVTIYDPNEIGAIMITSETDKISAKGMVKEFDIKTLDHYFDNTRSDRNKQLKVN
jgi:carbon-nitrogen hydrolase